MLIVIEPQGPESGLHLHWKSPGKLVTLDFVIFLENFVYFFALAIKNILKKNVLRLPMKLLFLSWKKSWKSDGIPTLSTSTSPDNAFPK